MRKIKRIINSERPVMRAFFLRLKAMRTLTLAASILLGDPWSGLRAYAQNVSPNPTAAVKLSHRDSMSVHPFIGVSSLNTDIVTFELNGYLFKIPRNYLNTAIVDDGDDALLLIQTWTPDFKGYDAYSKAQYASKGSNIVDREVDIYTFRYNVPGYGKQDFDDLNLPNLKSEEPASNGLIFAKHSMSALVEDDYVDYEHNYGDSTVIRCDKGPPFECNAVLETPQNILLQYKFKKSNLDSWRQIKSNVERLFNSFYAGKAQ